MKPVFMELTLRFEDDIDHTRVQGVLYGLSDWTHKIVSCNETETEGEVIVTVHILFNDGDELATFCAQHSFEDGDRITDLVAGENSDAEYVYNTRSPGPGLKLSRAPSRNWSFE